MPRFTANFTLYSPDGLPIVFSAEDDSTALLDTLPDLVDFLKTQGMTVAAPSAQNVRIIAVDSWMMGKSSKNDPCCYLYPADRRLEFAAAVVYVERFGELPFLPANVAELPHWKGAAPKKAVAKEEGMLQLLPSVLEVVKELELDADGSPRLSDKGEPIYRFARLLAAPKPRASAPAHQAAPPPAAPKPKASAPAPALAPTPAGDEVPWCEWCGERPALPGAPCDSCRQLGANEKDGPPPRGDKAVITVVKPADHGFRPRINDPSETHGCPNCHRDWRYYNPICASHVQPDGEPAPAPERDKALDPAALRLWLRNQAYAANKRKATPRQRADVANGWKVIVSDEALRRQVKWMVTGWQSVGEMPDQMVLALLGWMRPTGTAKETFLLDNQASDEVATVMEVLRDAANA